MKNFKVQTQLLFCLLLFLSISCTDKNDEKETNSIPTNITIIGQKITLIDKNNSPYNYGLWIKPINNTNCEAENMTGTDSQYLYSNIDDHTASLIINGYQVLTNTTYSYKWEITLSFKTPTQGTFRGTYLKGNTNFVAAISGDFYIGETNPSENNPNNGDESNDGDNSNNGNNPNNESEKMQAVVTQVEEYNGTHNIYVYGKYEDSNPDKYLKVGFCCGTTSSPKITDITIPEAIENPTNNSARTISGLQEGTKYYIRPYHVEGNNITYYQSTSVETLGKDIDLSAYIQNDHQFGGINYNIKPEGTYELSVSFWSIRGIKKESLGYVNNTSGKNSFTVGTYVWENYLDCTVSLKCIETGILYSYKMNLGWSASGNK